MGVSMFFERDEDSYDQLRTGVIHHAPKTFCALAPGA
jgi:hypothetical protein